LIQRVIFFQTSSATQPRFSSDRRFPFPAEIFVHGIDKQLVDRPPGFDPQYLQLSPGDALVF
jgi:hypothetical protein